MQQAQRLAAKHDPSGASFNVGPVVKLQDGTVITKEALKRRDEKQAEKARMEQAHNNDNEHDYRAEAQGSLSTAANSIATAVQPKTLTAGLHPDRVGHVKGAGEQLLPRTISKKHQKRLALYETRPPPPKPTIPEGVLVPNEEENWLALWDLPEDQIERRITRDKKRKAAERKALRVRQQTGKVERRAARDEKRSVYRDLKLEWKSIKGGDPGSIPTFSIFQMLMERQRNKQGRERN